jgi:hypothetical protein
MTGQITVVFLSSYIYDIIYNTRESKFTSEDPI